MIQWKAMYKRYVELRNLAAGGKYVRSISRPTIEIPVSERNERTLATGPTDISSSSMEEQKDSQFGCESRMDQSESLSEGPLSQPEVKTVDDAIQKKVYKSHKTSIVIIPPEDCWKQIQDIRREYDKVFERWMPHINMLYPFIPYNDHEDEFRAAAERIRLGLEHVPPFRITFPKEAFGYFAHRKKTTMWLKPLEEASPNASPHLPTPINEENSGGLFHGEAAEAASSFRSGEERSSHPAVIDLQAKLVDLFPDFKDLNTISEKGFQPHLSLGQFKPKIVKDFVSKFQQDWQEISFDVKEIYLISRVDFHDPFHIRHSVPLGSALQI